MLDEDVLIPLFFFLTIILLVLGVPLVRAVVRRMDREGGHGARPELAERLERMEHTLDAMAVEVERISENQRFTTRLLAGRGTTDAPPAAVANGSAGNTDAGRHHAR